MGHQLGLMAQVRHVQSRRKAHETYGTNLDNNGTIYIKMPYL